MSAVLTFLPLVVLATSLIDVAQARNLANPGWQIFPDIDLQMDFNARYTPEPPVQTMDEGLLPRVTYNNSQVWKVCHVDKKFLLELNVLRKLDMITMWGSNLGCKEIMVRGQNIEEVRKTFSSRNVNYRVLIEDLQKAIDEENPLPDSPELKNNHGHSMSWQAYHRLGDIHGYLDYLAKTYPEICSIVTIGSSLQGRPINLIKISNSKGGNKAVWIDGGVHAREWISPATATFIINEIVTNYYNDTILKYIDWYITPVVNPDGYEYSHKVDRLWMKNRRGSGFCVGTDLNRNFGQVWGGESATNICSDNYSGKSPFSEPETSAVRNFISNNKIPWKVYISFHSYGKCIQYPWGFKSRSKLRAHEDVYKVGRKAVTAIQQVGGPEYSLGLPARLLFPESGASDDWAKGEMGIKFSYTVKLRDNGTHGYILPARYILQIAKEAYMAVRAIVSEVSYLRY